MDIITRYTAGKPTVIDEINAFRTSLQSAFSAFDSERSLSQLTRQERRDLFPEFVRFVRREFPKPSKDIRVLDSLFNDYLDLCTTFNYSPTLFMFSELVSIDDVINHWRYDITDDLVTVYDDVSHKTVTKSRRNYIKQWCARCAGFLSSQLQNSDGTSVNRIFIAKAVYGIRDDVPQQDDTKQADVIRVDALPTLAINEKPSISGGSEDLQE